METKPIPSAEDSINPPLPSVEWKETQELGYDGQQSKQLPVCFHCGKADSHLLKCAKCNVAGYCSREHQIADWKHTPGHKLSCQSYARVGTEMLLPSELDKATVRTEVMGRIRFYVCPYAVHKTSTLGRGFLFLQSEQTLVELSITLPKNTQGHNMPLRSILIHFLTMGEFDSEVCREDFELTAARRTLQGLVENYDDKKNVVLLMRLRCGHVAIGVAPLVPDYTICKSLGQSYFSDTSEGALQLNIDDI